jgi:NAD+ diphosphatase
MPTPSPDVEFVRPQDGFSFCPKCAAPSPEIAGRRIVCGACGFCLYLNTTVSVTGFLRNGRGETLFIVRAKEPAKGKLAAPGGFVDPDEPAEDALRREMREEVGIEIDNIRFLCSFPNDYPYRGVTYSVCDLYFIADAASEIGEIAASEVTDVLWLPASSVSDDDLAFASMRRAFVVYQQLRDA